MLPPTRTWTVEGITRIRSIAPLTMRTLTGVDKGPEETVIVPVPAATGARNNACIPSTSIGVTSPIVVDQDTGTLEIGFPYASSGSASRTTVALASATTVAGEIAIDASGQATEDRETALPFASFPIAANCPVPPAGTVPVAGVTSIRLRPPGAIRIVARPDTLPFV